MRLSARVLAFAAMLAIACAVAAQADITAKAVIQPARVQVGQSASLSIEIQGAQGVEAPALDNLDGFDARYVGPSTQVSIVNGQMSASVTHRYVLIPQREGVFDLGPFSVMYEGKEYKTNPVQLAVATAADRVTGGAAGGRRGDNVRFQLAARAGDVYLHERVPVELTLYIRSTQVSDINFPTLPSDGLSIESFPQPDRTMEDFEGARYQVLRFHTFATPLQSGMKSLGPASIRLNVVTQGGGFFAQTRPMEVQSNALQWNVLPLPTQDQPRGFNGAVGQFTLDVGAAPGDVVVGDPVTVRMTIRGDGSLADARPPSFASLEGFKAYDVQESKGDNPGVRTFEQVLIPQSDHVQAVPSVSFSFFDPKARAYRVQTSQPVPLHVRPRENSAAPQIIASEPKDKVVVPEKLGRDIVYIKDAPGDLQPTGTPWYGGLLLLLWLPVPILVLVGAAAFDRQRSRLTGDARYARFSRAEREVRRELSLAENALAAHQLDECYDHVSRAVREYLGAKLDLPVGAVDPDTVARTVVEAESLAIVRRFFDSFEASRYTGRTADSAARDLVAQAQEIVAHFERRKSRKGAGR